jgi:hypothetical protein
MFALLSLLVAGFVFAGVLAILMVAAIAVKMMFKLVLLPFSLIAGFLKFGILAVVGLVVAAVAIPLLFAGAVTVFAVAIPLIVIGGLIALPFVILSAIF